MKDAITRCVRALAFALSFLHFSPALAEPLVTAIVNPFDANRVNLPYLGAPLNDDQGYIAITAKVSLPNRVTCVTPTNIGSTANFFVKNNLEISLLGSIEGFKDIDQNQKIPLATYKYSDADGKYCAAPGGVSIVMVPNHRFGLRGPTGAPVPKFSLTLTYSSKDQEQLSSLMTGWLNLATTITTGGANTTVAGLSNLMTSKALGSLSDTYNRLHQHMAEQRLTVDLPWTDLRNGAQSRRISFVESETNWFEPIDVGIQRIQEEKSGPKIKPLLDVVLTFEYRRSLFVDDSDIYGADFLPKQDDRIVGDNVLNYPHIASYPTIYQTLSSSAPSIAQSIVDKSDGSKCNVAFGVLREMGLNALDRALVINALLQSKPSLRQDPVFVDQCFGAEREAVTILNKTFGNGYIGYNPINPMLVPVRVAGPNEVIQKEYEKRTTELAAAFLIPDAPVRQKAIKSALQTTAPITTAGELAPSQLILDDQIASLSALSTESISCLYRMTSDPGQNPNEYRTFLLASIVSPRNRPEPYLLAIDFDVAEPHSVRGLQIRSLRGDPVAATHLDFLKNGTGGYPANSTCGPLAQKI